MGLWHEGSEIDMLTPNKVFVDTITTQCALLLPDDRMDGTNNSGPPRATRFSIPSYYQDKDLHGLYLPSKDILVLEGSVIGYGQGHNAFGSCDVPSLVLESYKATHNTHALPLRNEEKRRIENGDAVTMKRLDVGVNLDLPEDVPASRALVELAHEMIDKGMNTSAYGFGETVYRNQYSQSSAQKFYDKLKELLDTKGLPANLPNRDAILDFLRTKIRSEIVLRYPKLKAMDMTTPRECTFAMLKSELENAFRRLKLSGSVRAGLSALDLRDLKPMYRTTYRLWEHGDDLETLLEAKAYQRHIAYFESLGFDITTPPSTSGKEYALGDIFTLSNAVAPPPELWNGEDDAECALA